MQINRKHNSKDESSSHLNDEWYSKKNNKEHQTRTVSNKPDSITIAIPHGAMLFATINEKQVRTQLRKEQVSSKQTPLSTPHCHMTNGTWYESGLK